MLIFKTDMPLANEKRLELRDKMNSEVGRPGQNFLILEHGVHFVGETTGLLDRPIVIKDGVAIEPQISLEQKVEPITQQQVEEFLKPLLKDGDKILVDNKGWEPRDPLAIRVVLIRRFAEFNNEECGAYVDVNHKLLSTFTDEVRRFVYENLENSLNRSVIERRKKDGDTADLLDAFGITVPRAEADRVISAVDAAHNVSIKYFINALEKIDAATGQEKEEQIKTLLAKAKEVLSARASNK